MKTMTKEQLAELLNGNEYLSEMTEEQKRIAQENNLLVLFGQSDGRPAMPKGLRMSSAGLGLRSTVKTSSPGGRFKNKLKNYERH